MRSSSRRWTPVLAAAVAALVLAGCSATHVGESWQCPLAQGASCTSIAEADPAVPASATDPAVLFGEPLPGARRHVGAEAAGGSRGVGEACDGSCGFLAWFKAIFGGVAAPQALHPAPETPATAATTDRSVGPDGEAPSAPPVPVSDASLRVPEVVGRIWIAPFVDADGIYREAHWVRVVLEPAGWKLP